MLKEKWEFPAVTGWGIYLENEKYNTGYMVSKTGKLCSHAQ